MVVFKGLAANPNYDGVERDNKTLPRLQDVVVALGDGPADKRSSVAGWCLRIS
jgi:hypothetical protein